MSDVTAFWMNLLNADDVEFFIAFEKIKPEKTEQYELLVRRLNSLCSRGLLGSTRNGYFEYVARELIAAGGFNDSIKFLSGERCTVSQVMGGSSVDYLWTGNHRLATADECRRFGLLSGVIDTGYHHQYTIIPPSDRPSVLSELERLWSYALTQKDSELLDDADDLDLILDTLTRTQDVGSGEDNYGGRVFFNALFNIKALLADGAEENLTAVYRLSSLAQVVQEEGNAAGT
jgi:hypothetical protein